MFKKPVKVSAQNQLSGKDRKGIKNKLATQFDDQHLEALFNKNDKIVCNKISGSKMLIYMSDEYPLFVDGTGKQDFFPSVYACAAYQSLTKSVFINEGVQTFIFNGANLMWPGVNSFAELGNFKKDQVVSIKNMKREVIAVGALGCSLDQLKQSSDGSGIAAFILHFKGDRLWDMGTKQYPDVVLKAKEAKVQAKKEESKPQIKQQPKKEQKKDKKEVKQESESQQEQKPKGKGKQKKQQPKKDKKKQKKNQSDQQQEQKNQTKDNKNKEKATQTKAPENKQPQPVSDDQNLDFGGFVHQTKKERPQIQMEKKKVAIKFSDDEDDKKGKKKPQKKGGKKIEQSDEQTAHKEPPKKQKHQEEQEEQQDNKKAKGKKGKGKKQQEQSDDQQEKPEPKKQANKKKQGKKQQRKEESQEDNVQHQEKPEPKKQANKKKQGKKQYKKEESQEENGQQEKPEKEVEQKQEKEDKSAISSQLMDQHFKEAFLNVLKLTKVEAQLPIDSGRFFSDYMILARSEGVKLQVKDSSYKKLGKFYEQMAKQKLIQFKPAKEKKGQQGSTITKIFWQNEELKNYFPTIKRMREKEVEEKEQVYSKQKLKLSKTVQVDFVYKLNDQLKQILFKKVVNYMPTVEEEEAMSKQQDVSKKEIFLTEKQLKQKIEKYINDIAIKEGKQSKQQNQAKEKEGKQKEGKQKKVEKLVTISYRDNKFIYELLKSEIEEYEENLQKEEMMAVHNSDDQDKKQQKKKKDKHKKNLFRIQRGYLVNKIMKLAHTYYNISDKQTGLSKFKQGNFKGIQLIADKVVNKNVTKIIGLQNFIPSTVHEDEVVKQIHGFTNTLQLKFASSANVQNLPGKNAGKQIVVQGNFVDELQSLLMSQYGIKKEYITIQNKLGKKKKN